MQFSEKRYARRFPLRLPVTVGGELSGHCGETCDISAGGALFYSDSDVNVGSPISFTVSMPAAKLAAKKDVLVNCEGRVTRCSRQGKRHVLAVVIDQYQFQRT
jgi:hypothetical protein